MRRRTLGACAGVLVAAGIATLPFRDEGIRASSPGAVAGAQSRDEALRHARTRLGSVNPRALITAPPDPTGTLTRDPVDCQFVPHAAGGTSFKFECALANGEIVRVKYGHEPEINAEVAATRLLSALGYAADHVYLVPHLRCHGCTDNPYVTTRLFDTLGSPARVARGGADFAWVAVERKFEAPPIEDDAHEGWAWWELDNVAAPREDVDALRLLAVFLAHWDNKADNQRLVCMDAGDGGHARPCRDPLLMIQDVGATFGPMKVNLSQWRQMPIWLDRATCTVSMRAMPYGGSTFGDARITEAARLRVGRELASFSDAELRTWFAAARFPQFYAATDDGKDLAAWVQAYRHRVSQIRDAGPCPS